VLDVDNGLGRPVLGLQLCGKLIGRYLEQRGEEWPGRRRRLHTRQDAAQPPDDSGPIPRLAVVRAEHIQARRPDLLRVRY
jgi:hypothetical protein